MSQDLRFESFCQEAYSVVAARPTCFVGIKECVTARDIRLITYPGWESFFTTWAKAHGQWARLKSKLNEPMIHIGTLTGAIHAVQEGAGIAVIPTHCVMNELAEKRLAEWKPKALVARNPVYMAKRLGEKLPRRVELVIDILKQAKAAEILDA